MAYATANGTATAGSDYTAAVGDAHDSRPGRPRARLTVAVVGDTVYEPDETFTVALSSPLNATLGPPAAGTGTITNDDPAEPVSVSINDVTVKESRNEPEPQRLR